MYLKNYDISCLINSSAKSNSVFWYYIKQIMNNFTRAVVRIFSFGERWNVLFNSAIASLNRTFHLSPHENILTIAKDYETRNGFRRGDRNVRQKYLNFLLIWKNK